MFRQSSFCFEIVPAFAKTDACRVGLTEKAVKASALEAPLLKLLLLLMLRPGEK